MKGTFILFDLHLETSSTFRALTSISFIFRFIYFNRNSGTVSKTSQIFYQPDSDDDFDDEDPDEDLNI